MKRHNDDTSPSSTDTPVQSPGATPSLPPPSAPPLPPAVATSATPAAKMPLTLPYGAFTQICDRLASLQQEFAKLQAENRQLLALIPPAKRPRATATSPAGPRTPPDSPGIRTALTEYGSITDLFGPKATMVDTASITINVPGVELRSVGPITWSLWDPSRVAPGRLPDGSLPLQPYPRVPKPPTTAPPSPGMASG